MNDLLESGLATSIRTALIYVALLAIGYVASALNPQIGLWVSLALIVANAVYLWKITTETKRQARRDIMPTLVTLGMAYLLHQPLDYAFALLSVSALAYRLIELSSARLPRRTCKARLPRRLSGGLRTTRSRGSSRVGVRSR